MQQPSANHATKSIREQPVETADPLSHWPTFAERVRERSEAGRQAYGDRSFSKDPDELLAELQQEALDLAGWGYVLFARIERAREALRAASDTAGATNPAG